MTRTTLLIVLALAVLLPASVAGAAPEDHTHQVELAPGETADIQGGLPGGFNPDYFGLVGALPAGTCSSDPTSYCESVFIAASNPLTPEEIEAGVESKREDLVVTVTPTVPVADFDVVVYSSNADGDVLGEAGRDARFPQDQENGVERVFLTVTTREAQPTRYYVVHVVYFAAPSDYAMDVSFG